MSTDLRTRTPMNDTMVDARGGTARTLTIIGFVSAAIGVFLLPIVFATAAIVLGIIAYRKGDNLGVWAAVAGLAAFAVNIALAAWIIDNANDAGYT